MRPFCLNQAGTAETNVWFNLLTMHQQYAGIEPFLVGKLAAVQPSMRVAQKRLKTKIDQVSSKPYTTKIIKAGALLSDTKTLLLHWDNAASVQENLRRFREENLFGKASRSRVEDILAIFRQRYLIEHEVTKALVVLGQKRFPSASLDRILYFHSAKADRLLHDVVTEILVPLKGQGISDIDIFQIQRELLKWVAEGKTTSQWSESTTHRVTRGLLSTLRDFGVLHGAVSKRIAPAYLPTEAFAYIAFYLKQHELSGAKILDSPDWKLFFLPHEGVERFMVEAQQCDLLEYQAAGNVIRLSFPANTLEEYADVLAERAH